jgi:hypothetical protein
MESRIKECQLDLYADRTSAATMCANQLRLWFHSMDYVLLCALRRIGLHDSAFANATCGIRLKLLEQLQEHIDAFIAAYNETAEPFAWTKKKVYQRRFKNHRITQL